MNPIKLLLIPHKTVKGRSYQHLRITIEAEEGIVTPEDLKTLALPKEIQFNQGVILEGRAPIWVYGCLVHLCHPSTWVACYDPRFSGAIVVQTHARGVSLGSIIKIDLPS